MRSYRIAFVGLLGVQFLILGNDAFAQSLLPEEVLAKYTARIENKKPCVFVVKEEMFHTGPNLPARSLIQSIKLKVWRDASRWKLIGEEEDRYPQRGKLITSRQNFEQLFLADTATFVASDKGAANPTVLSWMDSVPDELRVKIIGPYRFKVIFDLLDGNGSIPLRSLLKMQPLAMRQVEMSNHKLIEISGEGKWGRISLWLDPDKDYLPRKILQVKDAAHWVEPDRPISTLPKFEGPFSPVAFLKSWKTRVENIMIENVQGEHVPTGFVLIDEQAFTDGTTVIQESHVKFSEIQFRADPSTQPFQLSWKIPNGTRVQVNDRAGISYEWQDGAIVPSVNSDSENSLRGNFFRKGGSVQTLMLLLLSILGLIVMWLLSRNRRRKKGNV